MPEGLPRLLRDLVHARLGVFFEDNRADILLEKLAPLVQSRGCRSFLDYYYLLKDNDLEEWGRACDALSVQETYFYREMAQVNALTAVVVPEWFQKRPQPLRIWSAACATGEEPYTIAMALAEAGFASHPIEIYASDASPVALEKAQAAIYREKSFRSLPPGLRQKYFQPVPGGWKLSSTIVGKVKLQKANLSDPAEISMLARAQVIFCRNVLIYFSPHAIRQTIATFASRMPSGGHLFVGAAESLLRLTADYELKEIDGALVYVRN